jgi:hypothetical protein
MASIALMALLYFDFDRFPEVWLSPFAVTESTLPEGFVASASRTLRVLTVFLGVVALFALVESKTRPRFEPSEYLAWPRLLRRAQRGAVFALLVGAEVLLLTLAVLNRLSVSHLGLPFFERLSAALRVLLDYGWLLLPICLLGLPIGALCVRDLFRFAFVGSGHLPAPGDSAPTSPSTDTRDPSPPGEGSLCQVPEAPLPFGGGTPEPRPRLAARIPWRTTRAVATLLAFTGVGSVLSLVHYPRLMEQLSPSRIVETYRRLAGPSDKLALLGVSPTAASYWVGKSVPTFTTDTEAFNWLMGDPRRWLVLEQDELPQLNSKYRSRVSPRRNLPVLDGRSSRMLLASNRRMPSEEDQNPFADWILDRRPRPGRPVRADLEGKLRSLGWDLATSDGRPTRGMRPGHTYRLTLYWEVLGAILPVWKTFVHIDGSSRRFNADHETLAGKYPLRLLLPGDFFADVHEFKLDLNFAPGVYTLYYGLFRDSVRLRVDRGKHHENRIEGGSIRVF